MGQATIEQLEQQIDGEVNKRFPGAVQWVAVLQYGDDPVIEPGELMVRLILEAAEGREGQQQALKAFEHANGPAIKQFRNDLCAQLPSSGGWSSASAPTPATALGWCWAANPAARWRPARLSGGDLTPVMARLRPVDLETLDALITAGIAASRAEAVRWALARIRERPAYAQLRERAREIERLKTEF